MEEDGVKISPMMRQMGQRMKGRMGGKGDQMREKVSDQQSINQSINQQICGDDEDNFMDGSMGMCGDDKSAEAPKRNNGRRRLFGK